MYPLWCMCVLTSWFESSGMGEYDNILIRELVIRVSDPVVVMSDEEEECMREEEQVLNDILVGYQVAEAEEETKWNAGWLLAGPSLTVQFSSQVPKDNNLLCIDFRFLQGPTITPHGI